MDWSPEHERRQGAIDERLRVLVEQIKDVTGNIKEIEGKIESLQNQVTKLIVSVGIAAFFGSAVVSVVVGILIKFVVK